MAEQMDMFTEGVAGAGQQAGTKAMRRCGAGRPRGTEIVIKLSPRAISQLEAIKKRDGLSSDATAVAEALAVHARTKKHA